MASRDAQFDGDHETDMSQSVLLAETSHSLIETSHWQKGKVVVKRCRNHSDPRTFTRFHNEVDALRLNKNRPHVAQMLDSDASNLTITLRLEQGQSIDKHVDSNSNSILSSSSCATIRRQMAGALAFLHSSSVIHDDVKPDNIMYSDEDQHTVLIDFGAALIQMPEDYFNPSGTPSYAPPEFLYRQKSAKGDIWGLGITMLFALGYITLPDGGWILPVALEGGTKARQEMLAWLAEVERLRIEMVARDALTASMLIADPTRRISSDELFQQLGMLG